MDEDAYVFLVDRLKDMIISGGENVYSAEVEQVLKQFTIYFDKVQVIASHPMVAMCAAIGIPDDKFGGMNIVTIQCILRTPHNVSEVVAAVVVPKAGADIKAEDVISHCAKFIG